MHKNVLRDIEEERRMKQAARKDEVACDICEMKPGDNASNLMLSSASNIKR